MEAAKKQAKSVNGVNVDELFGTIDVIKETPVRAQFSFRADNKWGTGGRNHTTFKGFYGAEKEHAYEKPFELDADEPPVLLGEGKAPDPMEYALKALAGCLTTTMVYHAAARGIELRGVESRLEGDLDLHGFLGLREDVPVGYKNIRVFFKIDGDISDEQREELCRIATKHSPIFNTISHTTPGVVQLEK